MSRPQPPCTSSDRPPAVAQPAFAGQRLDRADRQRKDDVWVAERAADPTSRAVLVGRDTVLVDRASGRIARARVPELGPLVLGIEDGTTLFVLDAEAPGAEAPGAPHEVAGASLVGLREVGETLPVAESGLAAYALALVNWHRRHRFCANCGTATAVREGGYMRACPSCGASHFPRIDPVVIMLVEHDRRLLLGRRHSWPPQRYSALAGFVAPGETVEQAVLREVWEESGITAHSPRFVASQPWPFPSSLMLGFHALSDGGEPFPRDRELEDVRWFGAAEVRAARDEAWPGPLKLPPRVAIARLLIDLWLDRVAPG